MPWKDPKTRREKAHERYLAHQQEIIARTKKYAEDHVEECRIWRQKWYLENQQRVLELRRKNYNLDKIRERRKTYPEKHLFQSAKARARRSGVEFEIIEADVIIPEFCPVYGMRLTKEGHARKEHSPSLDRIDPTKGYIRDNIWVISWKANRLKSNASAEDIMKLAVALQELAQQRVKR